MIDELNQWIRRYFFTKLELFQGGVLHDLYLTLLGRAGGQTAYGGTGSGDDLTLHSTSHATKGDIILNPSGGKVGIGTASPGNALHVHSSTLAGVQVTTDATGSTSADGMFIGIILGNPFVLNQKLGPLYLGTNGTERITIGSTGDVGIGTSSPNGLQITKSVSETARGADNVRIGVLSGLPKIILEDNGQTQWVIDNSAGTLRLSTPGSPKVTVDSSGNVKVLGTSLGVDNASNVSIQLYEGGVSKWAWYYNTTDNYTAIGRTGTADDFRIYDSDGHVEFNGNVGTAWTAVTYTSGWVDYDSTWMGAQYKKVGDLVFIRGLAKRTSGVATTIFTLPSGYRPSKNVLFPQISNDAFARVDVYPDGTVVMQIGSATNWVNLNGIVFSTA